MWHPDSAIHISIIVYFSNQIAYAFIYEKKIHFLSLSFSFTLFIHIQFQIIPYVAIASSATNAILTWNVAFRIPPAIPRRSHANASKIDRLPITLTNAAKVSHTINQFQMTFSLYAFNIILCHFGVAEVLSHFYCLLFWGTGSIYNVMCHGRVFLSGWIVVWLDVGMNTRWNTKNNHGSNEWSIHFWFHAVKNHHYEFTFFFLFIQRRWMKKMAEQIRIQDASNALYL